MGRSPNLAKIQYWSWVLWIDNENWQWKSASNLHFSSFSVRVTHVIWVPPLRPTEARYSKNSDTKLIATTSIISDLSRSVSKAVKIQMFVSQYFVTIQCPNHSGILGFENSSTSGILYNVELISSAAFRGLVWAYLQQGGVCRYHLPYWGSGRLRCFIACRRFRHLLGLTI